jgi:adenosine deaminase
MAHLDARDLRTLARAMPKAELHLHLDGSLRPDTAIDIARSRHIDAPMSWAGMRGALVAPEQCDDQADLLRAFDLPIELMQDAAGIERIASDLVLDKAADNVQYMEVRWAPLLHVAKGLTGRQVVEATWRGTNAAARQTGVQARLIATLMRSHPPEQNLDFVLDMATNGVPKGLVGIDLAGPEQRFPDPEIHRGAIDMARDLGLHVTLHAGEWNGAAQVKRSLSLEPERIAHGPLAIDDPEVVESLKRTGTWLDLCPTSNFQARIVDRYEDHPFRRLLRAGVPVTLNTDDLTVSDISLSEEYARAVERLGVTLPELWAVDLAAIDAAFCDEATKTTLREQFTAWGAGIPELHGS